MREFLNLDAIDSMFFTRELEKVLAKTHDVIYAPLLARTLFPVTNELGDGADVLVYKQYDSRGMAKIISAYADDLPRAEIGAKEFLARVRDLGASFGYNDKEIRQARMAGVPLQQRKSDAARRAIEELIDKIAFRGDTEHNLVGLMNNANIPRATAPNGASASPLWSSKTPAEILADLHAVASKPGETTLGAFAPNRLIMPIDKFNLISQKSFSVNDNRSVLEVFLQQSNYINTRDQVMGVPQLKGAGTSGVDVVVAYNYDRQSAELHIPMELTMKPVQERNLEYVTLMVASTAGLVVYEPLAFNIMEGI